jgi:hypothetical protein
MILTLVFRSLRKQFKLIGFRDVINNSNIGFRLLRRQFKIHWFLRLWKRSQHWLFLIAKTIQFFFPKLTSYSWIIHIIIMFFIHHKSENFKPNFMSRKQFKFVNFWWPRRWFIHWSFAHYESISITSILHHIKKLSILISCFSIHHEFRNLDLTSFIIDEISLTSFSSQASSSDGRSCVWWFSCTIQIFFCQYILQQVYILILYTSITSF